MALLDSVLPLVGGVAGATLLYFIVMGSIAYSRHKRDVREERRQERIERMTRDLWIAWMRREGR